MVTVQGHSSKQPDGLLTDVTTMTIAIATQKGGVGKTTTAITLAAGIARKGKRVLLIDVDSQANSSKVLLENYPSLHRGDTIYATIIDSKPLPVLPSKVPKLDIVPSHILLADTDMALTTAIDHREARLKAQLDKIQDGYEFIFLDCPPSLGWQTINALTASDEVMVVVEPGYFELDSIVQLSKTIQNVQTLFNPILRLGGFLFVKSEATIASRQSLQLLRQTYGDLVYDTVIPRNTDIKESHFQRVDIFEYRPQSTSAQAYSKLIKEVFQL